MASFALSLAAFAKKAGTNADLVVRKVVLDMGTRIVERSPVGDSSLWQSKYKPKNYVGGHFRANWQYGNFNGAGIPVNETNDIDASGQVSMERIAAMPTVGAAGMRHVLINNVPYAQRLEDGWSTQAPAGMIGLVVAEYASIVEDAADAISTGNGGTLPAVFQSNRAPAVIRSGRK